MNINYIEFTNLINESPKDKINDIFIERYKYLESLKFSNEAKGKPMETVIKGFINSKTPIKSQFLLPPFYLNDKDIYYEFIQFLNKEYIEASPVIFFYVQKFLNDKLGSFGNLNTRANIYRQNEIEIASGNNPDSISIKDFYNKNTAECAERAALANNLLNFIGYKSYYVASKLEYKGKNTIHAFNLIDFGNDKFILYDPMNPIFLKENDKTQSMIPAFSYIDKNSNKIKFNYDLTENIIEQIKVNEKNNKIEYEQKKLIYEVPINLINNLQTKQSLNR